MIFFICVVIASEEAYLGVALVGEDVRADAVQEKAIVGHHQRTSREVYII